MMSVSGVNTDAVQPLAAEKASGISKVPDSKEETQNRPSKPAVDEYVPEEPREPSGRYWVGKNEDGQIKIHFDSPERADEGAKRPEERRTADTSKVDREIEKLKKKQQELERRISTETNESKRDDLKRQLALVEQELRKKDNDTYRRQHTRFS